MSVPSNSGPTAWETFLGDVGTTIHYAVESSRGDKYICEIETTSDAPEDSPFLSFAWRVINLLDDEEDKLLATGACTSIKDAVERSKMTAYSRLGVLPNG